MARLLKVKQITAGVNDYVLTTSGGTAVWAPLSGITGNFGELNDLSDVTTGLPVSPTQADDGKQLFYDNDTNQWITDDTVTHGTSVINSKKASAGTISAGTPVYIVGFNSDLHTVEAANAGSSTTMPCIGLAAETLDDTNSKHVMTFGKLQGVDLSTTSSINPNNESWAINDDLYVSTTTGGLTSTRPTGASTLIQRIAKILRTGTTNGQLLVFNTARSAGLPNLTTSSVWAGNASNQPTESGSLFSVDLANSRVGVGTSTPAHRFNVVGSGTGTTTNTNFENSSNVGLLNIRDNGSVLFNQTSLSTADVRMRSGTNAFQFFMDAGLDRIGIQESAPDAILHVQGGTKDTEPSLQVGKSSSNGSFKFVDGGEADGRVLTSDANGNAAWEVAPSFTGNTSGSCITDIHVTNIHSCSPLFINPSDEGNIYFGSTSGVTVDLANTRFGVGLTSPTAKLHVKSTSNSSAVDAFIVESLAGTPLIHVESGGNIGINTATPSVTFQVEGASGRILQVDQSVDNFALGLDAVVPSNSNSVVIGREAGTEGIGDESVTIGRDASATGNTSTAVGHNARAYAVGATALGTNALAPGIGAVAIRGTTDANQDIAIGNNARAFGDNSQGSAIALGFRAEAEIQRSIAIGSESAYDTGSSKVWGAGFVSIGYRANRGAESVGSSSIAIGLAASTTGTSSIAIGQSSRGDGENATAIGTFTQAIGTGAIMVGDGWASGDRMVNDVPNSIAFGFSTTSGDNTPTHRLAKTANQFIAGSGNLGIGSAFASTGVTPDSTLHLGTTGTVATFKYVDGNQSDGYVLTSDSTGAATWQAAAGGGVSKYSATSAFTASVVQTITHSLGTSDIVVEVWDDSASPERMDANVVQTNGNETNALDITISVTGTYKIVVIG
jgi:hypothetical protein